MTPNQSHVAGLELAMDEMHDMLDGSCEARLNRLISEAKSAPAEPISREAVEVMAHAVYHPEVGYKVYKDYALWMTGGEWAHNPLMTVAQHNRIVAALTAPPSPDTELVAMPDLRELLEMLLIDDARRIKHSGSWRQDLHGRATAMLARIDAKLANLK